MIIGIVGSIASGKDTVADYLKEKGFVSFSHSDILREMMRAEGIETTIPNLTEYGNNLRETKGRGYLSQVISDKIEEDKNVIITSIRQVGEIEYYRERWGKKFLLIKLDAPKEMRLKRLIERARPGDVKSIAELDIIEAKQADGKGGGMNMNKCFEMADAEIDNVGTFEELYKKVDLVLVKMAEKQK